MAKLTKKDGKLKRSFTNHVHAPFTPIVEPDVFVPITQAATPIRINQLGAMTNENINVSMNFAVDTLDETFKVNWGQLVDYINNQVPLANYLPLAGGTMLGDIITSNGISVNDRLEENLYLVKGGVNDQAELDALMPTSIYETWAAHATINAPVPANRGWIEARYFTTSGGVYGQQTCYGQSGGIFYRDLSNGTWSVWRTFATIENLAEDLANYLPLAGGTLTGGITYSGSNSTPISLNRAGTQVAIQYSVDAGIGFAGMRSDLGFAYGPTADLSVHAVWRIAQSGNSFQDGDITAFEGQAANTNANRAALNDAGKVTAYEMIDHLLDKLEEQEQELADIKQILINAGLN